MARARRASASSRSPRSRYPVCGFTHDGLICGDRGSHFCKPRANHAQGFIEEVLVHTKGRWARKPFILSTWQREEIVRPAFGWVVWSKEWTAYVRRYQIVWIELARKNGKSELLAAIALYLLTSDGEEGAELYGAAKDTKQARKVWDVADRMVTLSPTLSRLKKRGLIKVNRQEKRIIYEPTSSYYEVIAADAAGELGHNPHGIIFDEIVSQPSRDLWDALKTGMGTRAQPLMVAATTAGMDPGSFAYTEHEFSARVGRNAKLQPERLVFMRNTPMDADWRDEKNWTFANPALGEFLSLEQLRKEAREAANNPAAEVAFRVFRLDQWVRSSVKFIDLQDWQASAGLVDESKLADREAFGGLYMASATEIAAWALTIPDGEKFQVLWSLWIPEGAVPALEKATGGQARSWIREGRIEVLPGPTLDDAKIEEAILADARDFKLTEVDYDPTQTAFLVRRLEDQLPGVDFVEHRQGCAHMSFPTKELVRLVLEKRYRHGGHPAIAWMMDGVALEFDSDGRVKPSRKRSSTNISGVVAAIMGLSAALRPRAPKQLEGKLFA